jgi:phospholipid/cholesterol/gamma-HCH transport system substrate-binding protein
METDPKAARRAVLFIGLFVLSGFAVVVYLFSGTQVSVPLLEEPRNYQVALLIPDVDNLVTAAKVEMAGVEVGEVREIERESAGMRVTIALDKKVEPLHQGVRIRVGERSLVGETYLDTTDGKGPAIPSGTTLPATTLQPAVELRDILYSFDAGTRQQLGQALRSLGSATDGSKPDVDALMAGFGDLGREGHTALDAIAAQSNDLTALTRETATLMNALDTGNGHIADLVTNAERITEATGDQRPAIEATFRKLPGVLDSADTATVELTKLAGALNPVAARLNEASPELSRSLQHLPEVSRDLRGLVSPLDRVLNRAPDTLHRVPTFGEDTRNLVPPTREILRDVNPTLRYLQPYGPEVGAFIANFGSIFGYQTEEGINYFRLLAVGDEMSVQTPTNIGVTTYDNPYPAANKGNFPGPFKGAYPRVEREPK